MQEVSAKNLRNLFATLMPEAEHEVIHAGWYVEQDETTACQSGLKDHSVNTLTSHARHVRPHLVGLGTCSACLSLSTAGDAEPNSRREVQKQ